MHEQRLGSRYLLVDRLGGGGMGEVFLARTHGNADDRLAVKLLRPELAEDPDLVSRFLQESRLLRGVRHPNVVRVLDLVAEGDRFGIVMEYVPDGDLRRAVPLPCPTGVTLDLLAQVADGLAAIHAAGITHRDLKPENVLVRVLPGGALQARVTDFGVSHRSDSLSTRHNGIVGTAGYLSPESAMGLRAGPEGDVYALGVMLYELSTGSRPFVAENPLAVIRAHAETPAARPPAMQDPIWELLSQMLAKDPAQRPPAAEVGYRLRALVRTGDEGTAPVVAPVGPVSAEDPTLLRAPMPAANDGMDPDASTLLRPPSSAAVPSGSSLSGSSLAGSSLAGSASGSSSGEPATPSGADDLVTMHTAGAAAVARARAAGAARAGERPGAQPSGPDDAAAVVSAAATPVISRRAARASGDLRPTGPSRPSWRDRSTVIPVALGVVLVLVLVVGLTVLIGGGDGSGTASAAPTPSAPPSASSSATATAPMTVTPSTVTSSTTPSTTSATPSATTSTPRYPVPAIPTLATYQPTPASLEDSNQQAPLTIGSVDPGAGTLTAILVLYDDGGTQSVPPVQGFKGPYQTTIRGLTNGRAYTFTARVCNSYGECTSSRPLTFTPYTIPTLGALQAVASPTSATVIWPALALNGNPRPWTCRLTADTFPHDPLAPNQRQVSLKGGSITWKPDAFDNYTAQEVCTDGARTVSSPVLSFRTH